MQIQCRGDTTQEPTLGSLHLCRKLRPNGTCALDRYGKAKLNQMYRTGKLECDECRQTFKETEALRRWAEEQIRKGVVYYVETFEERRVRELKSGQR